MSLAIQIESGHFFLYGKIGDLWVKNLDAESAVELAERIALCYQLEADEVFTALPTFGGKDGVYPAPAIAEMIQRTMTAEKLAGVDEWEAEGSRVTTTVGWDDCEQMDAPETGEC